MSSHCHLGRLRVWTTTATDLYLRSGKETGNKGHGDGNVWAGPDSGLLFDLMGKRAILYGMHTLSDSEGSECILIAIQSAA